jgi:DNA-binding response OmpR family regulator
MPSRIRICLVDDDVLVLEAMALGLRDAGYAVLAAPGAAAGLDAAWREGVDVFVTDLNMPGTSGAQLIAEARTHWPTVPIIAMTGSSTIEGRDVNEIARGLGADALLTKPFRVHQLVSVLNGVLGERAAKA